MASSPGVANTGLALASFEKELVCSICTEILYQPLTILNCLHTFCGSCLKEWFSHQHRKASSSRSSPSSANPYSCPTCRAEVRDVHHNATVSNLLELFLAANPSRSRSQEEKDDMDQIYKPDGVTRPGDKILPKVDRRRDRRARRDDDAAARERQMIEEARQQSLQDSNAVAFTNSLSLPQADRTRSASRDRDERRQRRRERERQRDDSTTLTIPSSTPSRPDRHETASPPTSSPRHPSAVEARQREHRMSHQASLRSLVSASDSGVGTGDSFDEARIMQEIIDEGLLGDIDVDALDEAEQDALAERIAALYRQRHLRPQIPNSPPQSSHHSQVTSSEQPRTRSEHRDRPGSTQPPANSSAQQPRSQLPPPSSLGRSNSQNSSVTLHHRRRASDQTRADHATGGSRATSEERQTAATTSHQNLTQPSQTVSLVRSSSTNSPRHRSTSENPRTASQTLLPSAGGDTATLSQTSVPAPRSPRHTQTMPISRPAQTGIAELDGSSTVTNAISPLTQYQEPSVTCFRCGEPDLQYDISRHCHSCNVNLCVPCYRSGKGCKHWFGHGHVAIIQNEKLKAKDESIPPSHHLIGRRYQRPDAPSVITTRPAHLRPEELPIKTTSNPLNRLQEGHFCDRCGNFANIQFWLCDICNDGEWGFCKTCVDTHHCCTHPLLPVAYHPHSITNTLTSMHLNTHQSALEPPTLPANTHLTTGLISGSNSRPQTPSSVVSNRSQREAGYDYLSINVNCDTCHQIILPSDLRYHCPFHSSDFDICISCYNQYIQHIRSRRDGGNVAEATSGWRKCPQGHRMIVVVFETDASDDGDGGMRRVVKHDLVGGCRISDAEIRAWNSQHNLYATPPTSPPTTYRGTWSWKEDATGSRRGTRNRSSTISDTNNNMSLNTTMRFPPDGGFGKRGQAFYAYWPDEAEDGDTESKDLRLPRGAEVSEIEDVNGDWWSGVYAGDVGIFPFGYVKEYT